MQMIRSQRNIYFIEVTSISRSQPTFSPPYAKVLKDQRQGEDLSDGGA